MNIFVNDILQILYYLLYDILTDNLRFMLAFGCLCFYIIGTITAYLHYRQKVKYPVLYVIPFLREVLILFSGKTNIKQALGILASALYCVGSFGLYKSSLESNIRGSIGGLAFICIALVIGAYLNYDFLCYCDDTKKRNRSLLKGILYYLFPFIYLYSTLPDDYKSRRPRAVLAKGLAIMIALETLIGAPASVKAETNHIVTNCPICDNSEQIVYKFCIHDNSSEEFSAYDFHYGVTSSNCEIIHLIDTNEDFGFRFDGDGIVCYFAPVTKYGYLDYSNTKYNVSNTYVPSTCNYDAQSNVYIVSYYGNESTLVENIDLYHSGVMNSNTDSDFFYFPYLPTEENIQVDYNNGYQYLKSNAVRRLPKGADVFNGVKSNTNYTSTSDENVSPEFEQGSYYEQDQTKWNTSDTVDVVAGILAGSVAVVGLDVGLDLVLGAVTAINPILGAALFGCTIILGATAGYSIGASLGSKIYAGFVSKDVSQTEKEVARKELKKEVIIDTATLAVSSAAVHYIKPKVYSTIDAAFVVKIKPTKELINHLENPTLKGNVISGGHNETNFIEFCKNNGIKYEVTDAIVPDGMKQYKYSVPYKDGSGYRTIRKKTVYDGINMSLDDYLNYGTELINSKLVQNNVTSIKEPMIEIDDSYGIKWRYYFDGNEVTTFYPVE